LEQYSWRDEEAEFNASLAQFRTAIRLTNYDDPVRLHFIHSRSTHANAVPLLLIPPFPFTNLSLAHLIGHFTTPDDATKDMPFHLVVPSLPGLGFSDAIPSHERMMPLIAELFDKLMRRLGYAHYLATNTAATSNTVSDIDWRVINHIAVLYPDSCLGVHLISPRFGAPTFQNAPLEWVKWKTATAVSTPMLGYSREDISASKQGMFRKQAPNISGMGMDKLFEPNTLAYALCDSPTGLLLFILMVLRILGPNHEFSNKEIIRITELTWLPGPEGILRILANSASTSDNLKTGSSKPKVGITTFSGNQNHEIGGTESNTSSKKSSSGVYTCIAWGRRRYDIVSSQCLPGNPGLLAWERPKAIAAGVRKLAKAIVASDKRLQESVNPETVFLEQVIADGCQIAPAERSGTTIQTQETLPPGEAAGREDAVGRSKAAKDAKIAKRPPTPMFPMTAGESSQELVEGHGDSGQYSSEGSPTTIKPVRRSQT
jgi:pimeloyl-ACP methyl ester carboxylesterase